VRPRAGLCFAPGMPLRDVLGARYPISVRDLLGLRSPAQVALDTEPVIHESVDEARRLRRAIQDASAEQVSAIGQGLDDVASSISGLTAAISGQSARIVSPLEEPQRTKAREKQRDGLRAFRKADYGEQWVRGAFHDSAMRLT
jgi:hypothetical protein